MCDADQGLVNQQVIPSVEVLGLPTLLYAFPWDSCLYIRLVLAYDIANEGEY